MPGVAGGVAVFARVWVFIMVSLLVEVNEIVLVMDGGEESTGRKGMASSLSYMAANVSADWHLEGGIQWAGVCGDVILKEEARAALIQQVRDPLRATLETTVDCRTTIR
jgi:hypothetical protein